MERTSDRRISSGSSHFLSNSLCSLPSSRATPFRKRVRSYHPNLNVWSMSITMFQSRLNPRVLYFIFQCNPFKAPQSRLVWHFFNFSLGSDFLRNSQNNHLQLRLVLHSTEISFQERNLFPGEKSLPNLTQECFFGNRWKSKGVKSGKYRWIRKNFKFQFYQFLLNDCI